MVHKLHSMPNQVARFTDPSEYINVGIILFKDSEKEQILWMKENIKKNLEEFNMTIGKLGVLDHATYFVSGGCFASMLQGEIPKDFDIYFYSEQQAKPIINLFTKDPSYMNEVEDVNELYRDALGVDGKMITENAITLKNKLQLITKHYGTAEEIRSTFDYVHCMPFYEPWSDRLYISHTQYDCCVNKILRIHNTANLTTWREDKFVKRGYKYGNIE